MTQSIDYKSLYRDTWACIFQYLDPKNIEKMKEVSKFFLETVKAITINRSYDKIVWEPKLEIGTGLKRKRIEQTEETSYKSLKKFYSSAKEQIAKIDKEDTPEDVQKILNEKGPPSAEELDFFLRYHDARKTLLDKYKVLSIKDTGLYLRGIPDPQTPNVVVYGRTPMSLKTSKDVIKTAKFFEKHCSDNSIDNSKNVPKSS